MSASIWVGCHSSVSYIRRLRAGLNLDAIPYAAREPGFGFDVSMFDEARLVLTFDDDIRRSKSFFHVPTDYTSAHQNILFAMRMNSRCINRQRIVDRLQGRQFFPAHGKLGQVESLDHLGLTHDGSNGLSSVARFMMCEHGLVRISGNHTITIHSRHISCRQNEHHPRMSRNELIQISELKARPRMRTPNHAYSQRSRRRFVRAEDLGAIDFLLAVEPN